LNNPNDPNKPTSAFGLASTTPTQNPPAGGLQQSEQAPTLATNTPPLGMTSPATGTGAFGQQGSAGGAFTRSSSFGAPQSGTLGGFGAGLSAASTPTTGGFGAINTGSPGFTSGGFGLHSGATTPNVQPNLGGEFNMPSGPSGDAMPAGSGNNSFGRLE